MDYYLNEGSGGGNSPTSSAAVAQSPVFGRVEDVTVDRTEAIPMEVTEQQQGSGRRPATVALGQMGDYEDVDYVVKTQSHAPVIMDGLMPKVNYKRNKAIDLAELSHSMGGQPHCQDYLIELVDGVRIEGFPDQFPKMGPQGNYGNPLDVNCVMFPSLKQDPPVPTSIHQISAIQATLGYQMHEMLRKRNEGCNLAVGNWCYIYDQGKKWEGKIWKIDCSAGAPTKYYLDFPMWNSSWKQHCFFRHDLELWVPPPKYELKRTHPLNRIFASLKSARQFERVQTVCGQFALVLFNDEFRYVMDLQFADGKVMPVCYLAIKVMNPQNVVSRPEAESERTPKQRKKGSTNSQMKHPVKRRRQAQANCGWELPDQEDTQTGQDEHRGPYGQGGNAAREVTFDEEGLKRIMRETVQEFRNSVPTTTANTTDSATYATKLQVTTAVHTAQEQFKKAHQEQVRVSASLGEVNVKVVKLDRQNTALAYATKKISDEQKNLGQKNKDLSTKISSVSGTVDKQEERLAALEKTNNELLTPQVLSLLQELASGEVDSQVLEQLKANVMVQKMEALSQETNPTFPPGPMEESPISNTSQLDMFRQQSDPSLSGSGQKQASEPAATQGLAPPTSTPAPTVKSTITRPKTPHPTRPNDNRVDSKKRLMFSSTDGPDSMIRKKDFNEISRKKQKLQKFVGIHSHLGTSKVELEHRRIERRAQLSSMLLGDGVGDTAAAEVGGENGSVGSKVAAQGGGGIRGFAKAALSSTTTESPQPIMKYDTFKPTEEKLVRRVFDKASDDERFLSIENHMGLYVVTIPWKTKGSIAHCESTDGVTVLPRRELIRLGDLAKAEEADTACAFWRMLTERYLPTCDEPIHWTTTPKRPPAKCVTMDQLVRDQPPPWGFLIQSSLIGLRMVGKDGTGDVELAVKKVRSGVAAIQRYESNWVREHGKRCRAFLDEK